jgi:hypothetical protein
MLAYPSLADGALSEAIEIMEKLLYTDLALEDLCLHPLLNVKFDVKHICWLGDAETTKVLRTALCDL